MIDVTCAIITNINLQILVTQRSSLMPLPLKWEFPGGKVESGETEQVCLRREIKEELDIDIVIIKRLKSNVHVYGTNTIRLIPFICEILTGEVQLKEHLAYKWVYPNQLLDLDWADADVPIVQDYINQINVI